MKYTYHISTITPWHKYVQISPYASYASYDHSLTYQMLPVLHVQRIMMEALYPDCKPPKETKEFLQVCLSKFITHMTTVSIFTARTCMRTATCHLFACISLCHIASVTSIRHWSFSLSHWSTALCSYLQIGCKRAANKLHSNMVHRSCVAQERALCFIGLWILETDVVCVCRAVSRSAIVKIARASLATTSYGP